MNVIVEKHRKAGGYVTRYWSVKVDGELLAVTLYRKGAEAVAKAINHQQTNHHATKPQNCANSAAKPQKPTAGVATYRTQ